jgi:hypothetical protein
LPDSANVFNDSPSEELIGELMPIEQAPIDRNLREPRGRSRDFSTLLWLCGWGVATAIALSALAITSQTQSATDRLRSIFAINEPTAVARMPPRVAQLEAETQMLLEQVRFLNADRDRLAGRITLLESSINDITGAIKRQAAITAAALAAAKTPPPAPGASVAATAPPASAPASAPAAQSSAAAVAPPEKKADPTVTSSVSIPASRATAAQAAVEPDATPPIPAEFGLELGSAPTLDGVRQRWISVKANFGPLLSGLHPLAAPERRQGKAGYRLVAGPLPNSPAATGLCAHFNAAHTACKAVKFEGEEIAQR